MESSGSNGAGDATDRSLRSPTDDRIQAREDLRREMRDERLRLESYRYWTNDAVSPEDMARAGFYFYNDRDRVECPFCCIRIENWEFGDVPIDEHRRMAPRCPFVNGLAYDNIPRADSLGQGDQMNGSLDAMGLKLNPGFTVGDLGVILYSASAAPSYSIRETRLNSFFGWPHASTQKPCDMADAGFYFTGVGDQAKCYRCGGGLRQWEPLDDPWVEHAKFYPYCVHLMLSKGLDWVKAVNERFKSRTSEASGVAAGLEPLLSAPTATQEQLASTSGDTGGCEIVLICKFCRSKRLETVALPCGHLFACVDCSNASPKNCPKCLKPVAGHLRFYH